MCPKAIVLSTTLSEFRQCTLGLYHQSHNPTSQIKTYLMLKCDIEIILKSFTELLTVFLIFPHPRDSSSHLGIGLVHTSLKSFVE